MNIRLLQMKDNSSIEKVIRDCLIEFGGNRSGLAWEDDSLHHLSDDYNHSENRAYWVVEEGGEVLGVVALLLSGMMTRYVSCKKCIYLSRLEVTG